MHQFLFVEKRLAVSDVMKLSSILPLAVLPAALVNGQRERPSRKAVVIPNRFIVELKEPEGLARRDTDPTAVVHIPLSRLVDANNISRTLHNYTRTLQTSTST